MTAQPMSALSRRALVAARAITTATREVCLKVCCIQSLDEARLALDLGAAALGLVSRMPSGPGVIDDALIASIARAVPRDALTVLLTSETEARPILELVNASQVRAVQLCADIQASTHAVLRAALPETALIQVVHVRGRASYDEAMAYASREGISGLLLDSGNPGAAIPELGGTGRLHDWTVSRDICRDASVPVFLAGGLRPDNIGQAHREVAPFGFDVCTGVRTNGALDRTKLKALVEAMMAFGRPPDSGTS